MKREYNGFPSVTEILQDVGITKPFFIPDIYLKRGSDIHLACELDDKDNLDESSISPEYSPYLEQWREFKKEIKPVFLHIEIPLISQKYHYGGTIDRILTIGKTNYIIDIKTGALQTSAAIQLAGYSILAKEHSLVKKFSRAVIILDGKTKYKFREIKSPIEKDEAVFLSALRVFNWKKEAL